MASKRLTEGILLTAIYAFGIILLLVDMTYFTDEIYPPFYVHNDVFEFYKQYIPAIPDRLDIMQEARFERLIVERTLNWLAVAWLVCSIAFIATFVLSIKHHRDTPIFLTPTPKRKAYTSPNYSCCGVKEVVSVD